MHPRVSVMFAVLLFASTCSLLPSAPYDPAFDAGVVNLRKDVDAFFGEVAACNGTDRGTHSAFAGDYRTFTSRIAGLRGQASRHPRNDSTLQSLDLLRENFDKVESTHRDGLRLQEVQILRELVDTQLRLLIQLERSKRGSTGEATL